jgi:DNA-binding transcriptional LysR family regulator
MNFASVRQIEVFVQTVACGSLRGVAELLHMTPSAASMALAELAFGRHPV